jgi:hypothetical protein
MNKVLLVQPEELCNPLNNEFIHILPSAFPSIMPMDEFWLATQINGVETLRYRVRVILSLVQNEQIQNGDWFTRIHDRIEAMYLKKRIFLKSIIENPNWKWRLLCEPIEDQPPRIHRKLWTVGRHREWCSITVPNNKRIYCVRRETTANEIFIDEYAGTESLDLFSRRNNP